MSKYIIWNGEDTVYTYGYPGKFTAAEWLAKHPWAEVVPVVLSGEGAINGAFCMPLADMLSNYAKQGVAFTEGMTDQEKLDAIEAWEDAKEAEAAEAAANEAANAEINAASMASIAASLEYQNMMTLDDVEV